MKGEQLALRHYLLGCAQVFTKMPDILMLVVSLKFEFLFKVRREVHGRGRCCNFICVSALKDPLRHLKCLE